MDKQIYGEWGRRGGGEEGEKGKLEESDKLVKVSEHGMNQGMHQGMQDNAKHSAFKYELHT